jgi:prepilin-type N-terminal cleavage/methylation domain-containing protein
MFNKFMKGFKKNKKGFTLTELVIVVAILGILAAIVVPIYAASLKDAKETADNANKQALQSAAALYVAENGWPPDTEEWTGKDNENWKSYLTEWPSRQQDSKVWKVTITGDDTKTIEVKEVDPPQSPSG